VNLVCDEAVDEPIVARLRADGHDVTYVRELSPSITDDEVLDAANRHMAPLVTNDKDFGELIYRLGRVSHGVVLLRLAGLSNAAKADIVSSAIRAHASELDGGFTVISPGMVRIRRTR
jgi:predicted nuclease of predicted toxin-antitoxin system